MATLGTQNISTSYPQLLKVSGNTPFTSTLLAIATGDESSVSALQISTLGVSSSGTLNSAGATTLASSLSVTGAATFSSSLGVTGAATLSSSLGVTGAATLSSSLGVTGAVTLSSSLGVTGVATFSTSINASAGTATIGTATISTATISTATIPTINGVTTFATGFTSSTGTNTLGTIASTTISNTGVGTTGTLQVGASGPKLTAVSFGTAAFTSATAAAHNVAQSTTVGTFALTGAALGDIVFGSLDSLGSTTGTTNLGLSFYPKATNVVQYSIVNLGATAGTIPAGIFFATAMRFTA